ncbi:uncharacterized protein N7525_005408 [Penicillium rubens]|uniref:uncharacterized protein n=1 Tax=Penicillium rubens TaxID=1108849 RepID=UPI002A5AFFBD|nr:uncharacterized protein N7525_005408 [Penicillium rubens]KAJ5840220.1 hypothetical protein N7525_005408 [Penicillium rubens]KAJ5868209.1 hypothetical protein N7534_002762 [Penicillium rubens]
MASVATKTATPVMPPSFSMSQDISRAMTASTQKTEKTRSVLIDGMPPAPPPSPVAFSKGKAGYNNIPSLSLDVNLPKSDIPVDGVTVAHIMAARRVFSCIGVEK